MQVAGLSGRGGNVEETARQLDNVRDELVNLLYQYTTADEPERSRIYERCETLGGEIQELIGLLKLSIRSANRDADAQSEADPEYARQIDQMSHESLVAIHAAGQEVNSAVRLLRESRPLTDAEPY